MQGYLRGDGTEPCPLPGSSGWLTGVWSLEQGGSKATGRQAGRWAGRSESVALGSSLPSPQSLP